jgi:hypothetical protein
VEDAASFHPTKIVPDRFTTIVGSTCQRYGDVASVTRTFGEPTDAGDGVGPLVGTVSIGGDATVPTEPTGISKRPKIR